MESVIVQILLGADDDVLEMMLPAHVPLNSLVEGIVHLIMQARQSIQFDPASVMIFNMDNQCFVHMDWTLSQSKISDGTKLMIC